MAKQSDSLEQMEKELQRWPEVNYKIEHCGTRHPRLWVSYNGAERFVPFSFTHVGKYGVMQKVTQLRRTLRDIGANRE